MLTSGILTASIGLVNNKNLNKEKKVMETISVTIPREKRALIKTADYLRSLAGESVGVVTGAPIVEVMLNPQKEADDMGDRIDRTVAVTTAPVVEAPHVPTVAGLEVDSDGAPWDARIHSGGKTFMASGPKVGTWKLIRGVDQALVEQVKAELLATAVVETPPPAAVPIVEILAAALPPVEVPVVAAPIVEIPPAAAVVPVTTYTGLITLITDQSKPGGVLQANDVKDAIKASGAGAMGVTTLPELAPAQHIAYIPLVAVELERIWATRV